MSAYDDYEEMALWRNKPRRSTQQKAGLCPSCGASSWCGVNRRTGDFQCIQCGRVLITSAQLAGAKKCPPTHR